MSPSQPRSETPFFFFFFPWPHTDTEGHGNDENNDTKQAEKVLFELDKSGDQIEAVMMNFSNGKTSLCISSQSGCALACSFCATGAIGFKKQLSSDQIVDQVCGFSLPSRFHSLTMIVFHS